MLCTPPAFILSQDQTLESLYLISPWRVQICSSAFSSFSYFCLSCICSLRNFRVPFLHILLCLYFSLRCSIFNDRFAALFRDSFVIISHLSTIVNRFFEIFSNFFKKFFRGAQTPRIYNNLGKLSPPPKNNTAKRIKSLFRKNFRSKKERKNPVQMNEVYMVTLAGIEPTITP